MGHYRVYSAQSKTGTQGKGTVLGEYNKFVIGIVVLFQRAHVKTLYLQSIITYLGVVSIVLEARPCLRRAEAYNLVCPLSLNVVSKISFLFHRTA